MSTGERANLVVNTALTIITLLGVGAALWIAIKTRRDSILVTLFGGFTVASQMSLEYPSVLYDVHGLDSAISQREAQNIAYLGIIMDSFQHYYGHVSGGKYDRMVRELTQSSNFLSRVLSHPANHQRWTVLKSICYGDFDASFVTAVDSAIKALQKDSACTPTSRVEG
jgi:hypothetical protein